MQELVDKLGAYTAALSDALKKTSNADERPIITQHLAACAVMYTLLQKHDDIGAIEELVKSEDRAHGLSFISGEAGEKIASAWSALTRAAGNQKEKP